MKNAHFLCNINDDSWAGYVGSLLLVSVGPVSQAYLQTAYQELRASDHDALDLNTQKLPDFSVRQVYYGGAKERLAEFCEAVRASDDPMPVPQSLLPNVLRRASAGGAVSISRLPIYHQGSLELVVYLPDMFKGRGFLVDGQIDLPQLAKDFPAAVAGSKQARTIKVGGREYKLKPSAVLSEMPLDEESLDASVWLMRNTYARGYSKAPAQSFPAVQLKA